MRRLNVMEWCLMGTGVLFVGTGLWLVLSPRPTTVVYHFYRGDEGSPGTHWYSLSPAGVRRAGFGVIVVGAACLWFALAGTRGRHEE